MNTPSDALPAYEKQTGAMAENREKLAQGFARQIIDTVGPFLNKPTDQLRLLDVGSGYGFTALELAQSFKSVVGIEPCSSFVERAKQ